MWLDNKRVVDEWRVMERMNEIETEELVLHKDRGYQLSITYFSIDPVQTFLKVEYKHTEQPVYSLLDNTLTVNPNHIICEDSHVDFILDS